MTTISAQIIADSISPTGKRLTTMQLRYPRFIHAEELTHRALSTTPEGVFFEAIADGLMYDKDLSRNASSSRAIPVERMIQDILDNTAMPIHWGKNQPGMQAKPESEPITQVWEPPVFDQSGYYFTFDCEKVWLEARDSAIQFARRFHAAGYHKQVINRLLEPFMHINVVVTATEWANFFGLRDHDDAEPHIRLLAQKMKDAMASSKPEKLHPGEWHLPYVTQQDRQQFTNYGADNPEPLIKVSVARCARVSYLTHDGRTTTVEEDVALFDRLVGGVPLHASPTEHQATPDGAEVSRSMGWRYENPHLHGNFEGWVQYRKTLPNENIV